MKRIYWLLKCMCLLLISGLLTGPAVVYGSSAAFYSVEDEAALLSDAEETSLAQLASEVSEQTGWDVMVWTTDDTDAASAQTAAEDYFMDNRSQLNGVVCLIDMDHREIYLATSGDAIDYLTDDRIDDLLDEAYEYISDGQYAETLEAMLAGVLGAYESGIPGGHYRYNETTGEVTYTKQHMPLVTRILIGLAAGIAAAAAFAGSVFGKYRMHFGKYKYDWHANGKLDLTHKQDRLVNHFVTRRRIPRDPPPSGGGGGGSTVHTGSGGNTFGGGGRKF